jgi:stage II sporulation protein R
MDGVFMRFLFKIVVVVLLFSLCLEGWNLGQDHKKLTDDLIRLHVVAASDTAEDQKIKLQVRDAVVRSVDEAMSHVMTQEQAEAWLQENLPQIQQAANDVLRQLGCTYEAVVTFTREAFPRRNYDTFSLPSGVYRSLRITLGEGQGHNWWCVVFPTLCMPAAGEDTESVAVGAGFSENLTDTVTGKQGYQVRFYLLDVIGKLENFLFQL